METAADDNMAKGRKLKPFCMNTRRSEAENLAFNLKALFYSPVDRRFAKVMLTSACAWETYSMGVCLGQIDHLIKNIISTL